MADLAEIITVFKVETEVAKLSAMEKAYKDMLKSSGDNSKMVEELKKKYSDFNSVMLKGANIVKGALPTKSLDDFKAKMTTAKTEIEQFNLVISELQKKQSKLKPNTQEYKELGLIIRQAKDGIEAFGFAEIEVEKTTTSLRGRLREVKEQLTQLEDAGLDNTETYRNLSRQAGALADQYGDLQQRVKILSSDTKYIDFGVESIQTAIAFTQIYQGSLVALGASEEEAAAATAKLTALLNIAQGIQQVRNALLKEGTIAIIGQELATKAATAAQLAFNAVMGTGTALAQGFRLALAATGIGLVIAGIVLTVKALNDYNNKTTEAKEKQSQFNEVIKESAKDYAEARVNVDKAKNAIQSAKEGVISKKEALKIYNETLGKSIGFAKDLDEAEQLLVKNGDKYIALQFAKAKANAAAALQQKALEKQLQGQFKTDEEYLDYLDKTAIALYGWIDAETKANFVANTGGKARREEISKSAKEAKYFNELQKKFQEEAVQRENELNNTKGNITESKVSKEKVTATKKTQEDLLQVELDALEKRKNELDLIALKTQKNEEDYKEKLLMNEVFFSNEKLKILEKYHKDLEESTIEAIKSEIALNEFRQNAILAANNTIFQNERTELARLLADKAITQEQYNNEISLLQLNELETRLQVQKSYGIKDLELEEEIYKKKAELADKYKSEAAKEFEDAEKALIERAITLRSGMKGKQKDETKKGYLSQYEGLTDRDKLQKGLQDFGQVAVDTTQEVVNVINSIKEAQISAIDEQIEGINTRIEDARELALAGNAEVLQEEQDRLRQATIERKRLMEEQARANRIAQVSAQLLAIAQAAAQPFPFNLAAVPAVLALLATSLGKAKGYEKGTDNAERGWKMVGEAGPELMWFNGGETVLNNKNTNAVIDTIGKGGIGALGANLMNYIPTEISGKVSNLGDIVSKEELNELRKLRQELQLLNEGFNGLPEPNINLDADGLTIRMNKLMRSREKRR